jgi:polar amino acid transport system substrate-binding protein
VQYKLLSGIFLSILLCCPLLAQPLQVFGNSDLPPLGYTENGTAKGFGVEIAKAVLDEAGIEYQIRLMPWIRAYEMAKNANGIVFGMYWTKERAELFDYSDALWQEKVVLVTAKGKEFPFQEIDDLRGKKIILQRKTRPGDAFSKAMDEKLFDAIANNDPISRLKFLQYNRADAGIFNPGISSVIWNAKLAGLKAEDFTVLEKPLAEEAKYIGIAKSFKNEALLKKINQAIQKLKENGTIDNIISAYEISQ